ncbi:hypothetical protein FAD_1418 [Ferroplasma acidiphilum]|jgi:hypothetical protein|uniref:Uncharacterized protein n=1 Tax=Ferroplasma acidiphilum TaxID=74969 RepID=A0A1V0N588_9ARCH|nr:hypothetical protein FAD_1418 [Ferroplasma acidiphilum]
MGKIDYIIRDKNSPYVITAVLKRDILSCYLMIKLIDNRRFIFTQNFVHNLFAWRNTSIYLMKALYRSCM